MEYDKTQDINEPSMSRQLGIRPLQWFAEPLNDDPASEANSTNNKDNNPENNTEPPANPDKPEKPSGSKPKVELTPEVTELIEEARRQEKSKQYATIEENKRIAKEAKQQLEAALAQLEELKKQTQKSPENEKPKEAPPVDNEPKTNNNTPAPADDKVSKLETLVTTLASQVQTLTTSMADRDAKAAKDVLEQYKTAAISAASIPAEFAGLISGNSKEAIDTAINAVKNGIAKVAPATPAGPARSGSLLTANIRLPGAPGDASIQAPELTAETVNGMNMEQFAEFRKQNPQMFGGAQRYGFQGLGFGGAGLKRQ